MGTYSSNSGTDPEDIYWGPGSTSGGGAVSQVPFPTGAAVVWGTSTFSSPPLDDGQGLGVIDANWEVDWLFAAGPDDDCPDCRAHDKPAKGSVISPRGQALGEDVDIVGTPFSLHYESSRVPGHAGADLFALKDALSLGGWTLSAHHVFEPLLLGYCAGGSCTPYATIPKAVFFGDGNSRNDADVQAVVSLNGNYLITSEDGSEVYVFNGKGMHLQTRRPFTGVVLFTFAYDTQNRLISVTDGNGNVTSIDRDGTGKPLSITSPYGQKTTLTVDANGYLSKITDPAGHSTKLISSSTGLLESLTDPNGRGYTYTYDSMGMLTKHSDPAGGSIPLARTSTATGYSVLNTTAAGRKSTYAVTFASTATQTSQSSTTTWPNGLIATGSQTQQDGQATDSATLPNGSSYTTTLGPDPRWGMQVPVVASESLTRGNLTETITQSRTATLGTPGDPFSLTSQTQATNINGRIYTSVYTASNQSIVDKTPVGRTTTTLLDSQERASSVRLGSLAASSFTYDTLGRISAITQGTRITTLTYDANGNLASTINPLNLTRSYTYDAAGNLLTTTLEDGRVASFTYDADGNLRSVTPPGEAAHAYSYSPVNLPTTYTPPSLAGTGATTYTYDTDRDLTKVTRPDGAIISNKYDSAGRLSSMVLPTASITYAYSATTGHLSKATVAGGEAIAYSYNGSLPTRAAWTGTVAGTVTRAYNNNFWKSSEGVTGGSNIAFTYDKDGLLTKAGSLTLARSPSTGLYTGGTLASTTDSIAYNTFAEPTSYTAQFGPTILYGATYTRDKIGRISAMIETIGGTTTAYAYTFDKTGRITAVKKGGVTVSSYVYDQNSNRVTATTSGSTVHGTYDAQDRLLTYGTASYTYTANGELATKTVGSQTTTYQYDALENLTGVTLPGGTAIAYILDAASNRVGKQVNGLVTLGFLYDGVRLVAQLDSSNNVVSQFVYASESGAPEYMMRGGVTYRIFADHRGSPRLVLNSATGAIAQRIDYDEFGNVTNDTNPGFQPFGFAGGLYDPDTKLVRFGARDYDASAGRWTAKDPIRFDGGDLNLYGYVVNDPLNLIDPSGLEGKGKGTCPCKASDAPTRDKELSDQTKKAAEDTIKTPDGKTSTNGPKLPENPNSDRIGFTKAPGSKTTDLSNPVSVEKGGMTFTPTSASGKLPGTNVDVTLSIQLTPDLSRFVNSQIGLQCEFNWGK
jgi:RHS repeat-associated protein